MAARASDNGKATVFGIVSPVRVTWCGLFGDRKVGFAFVVGCVRQGRDQNTQNFACFERTEKEVGVPAQAQVQDLDRARTIQKYSILPKKMPGGGGVGTR